MFILAQISPSNQTRNSSGANKPERNYYNCRKWWHSCVDFFNQRIFLESQWNQNINNSVVSGTTTKTNDYATWFTFHCWHQNKAFFLFWKIREHDFLWHAIIRLYKSWLDAAGIKICCISETLSLNEDNTTRF